jgi:alpha-methylacyl-CoA racemase
MKPLRNLRIVSLALNLPGPAALMRCKALGARCVKIEPPNGDPMQQYSAEFYAHLHAGIRVRRLDLRRGAGQAKLHDELAKPGTLLLTSFRPSALRKLGLDRKSLHKAHPQLSQVAIVGSGGARAEEPGHDLTYMAEAGLVQGTLLPATLYADMSGALLVVEAILSAALRAKPGFSEVALADAALFCALPQAFDLTGPNALLGGAHAGYQVLKCADGRVAIAALEPHFAARLAGVVGMPAAAMTTPAGVRAVARWAARQSRAQLQSVALAHDLPLHTF